MEQKTTHEEAERGLQEHLERYKELRQLKTKYVSDNKEVVKARAIAKPYTQELIKAIKEREQTAKKIIDGID